MTEGQASAIVDRLVHALNDHDLDGMLSCISASYVNDTPAHPERGFVGRDQVGSNWAQIFAGVPDVHAVVTRIAVDHETVWSEWEITGTRTDCTPLLMRGVVIFRTAPSRPPPSTSSPSSTSPAGQSTPCNGSSAARPTSRSTHDPRRRRHR